MFGERVVQRNVNKGLREGTVLEALDDEEVAGRWPGVLERGLSPLASDKVRIGEEDLYL